MKNRVSIIGPIFLLLVAIALVVPVAFTIAQDQPTDGEYAVVDDQVDSGGGEMADDEYAVFGSAGVPYAAGEPMADGEYTVEADVIVPSPPANAYIHLQTIEFTFGSGWNGVVKEPLAGMYVEVYDESCPDVAGYGNWNWNCDFRKEYFDTVRANCEPVTTAITDVDGEATIDVYSVPGSHVILGLYETEVNGVLYELYLAKKVQIDELGSTKEVKLGSMIFTSRFVSKVRVLPLMGTIVTGSELDLFEPEYIVWEAGQVQEDFPFILESAETWMVDTSLEPPEGYVPDETTKATYVEGSTETTVFEVTEVGSTMDYTHIEHDIREMRDGKVVKRVHLKHGIGTKSHGKPERFGPVNRYGTGAQPPALDQIDTIKLHEVFTGNKPSGEAGNTRNEKTQHDE